MFSNLSDAKQYEEEKAPRRDPHDLPNWRLLECWIIVNDGVSRLMQFVPAMRALCAIRLSSLQKFQHGHVMKTRSS